MQVHIQNDGPVTIPIESPASLKAQVRQLTFDWPLIQVFTFKCGVILHFNE